MPDIKVTVHPRRAYAAGPALNSQPPAAPALSSVPPAVALNAADISPALDSIPRMPIALSCAPSTGPELALSCAPSTGPQLALSCAPSTGPQLVGHAPLSGD